MQFAIAALSSAASALGGLASSAGAAAGAAAPAAAGAGGLGSLLSSGASIFGTILSGGLGLVGAMSAARAGKQDEAEAIGKAKDAEMEASQERLDGDRRAADLRRGLLKELGERDVAYAASGVDLSFGTPVIARAQADEDAARALAADRDVTDYRGRRLAARADLYRAQGAEARAAGKVKAAGIIGQTLLSTVRRG